MSLIDKDRKKFFDLPNNDLFNDIYQSVIKKKDEIETLISNNNNQENFYIIYEISKNNFYKYF